MVEAKARPLADEYVFHELGNCIGNSFISEKTRNPNQSLRAITIRQIYLAEQTHSDAEFVIDGAETTQVRFTCGLYRIYINQILTLDHTRGSGGRGVKASHQYHL